MRIYMYVRVFQADRQIIVPLHMTTQLHCQRMECFRQHIIIAEHKLYIAIYTAALVYIGTKIYHSYFPLLCV